MCLIHSILRQQNILHSASISMRWRTFSVWWCYGFLSYTSSIFLVLVGLFQYCFLHVHIWFTGYKMRTHIAKSLQNRCKAIWNAVKVYNDVAVEIGRPTIDWSRVSHYAFLEEFTLLAEATEDIQEVNSWNRPSVFSTRMKKLPDATLKFGVFTQPSWMNIGFLPACLRHSRTRPVRS